MDISSICDSLNNVFESIRPPLTAVPPMLLASATIYRPGMSAMLIASNIIARQSEAGAPFGPNTDGSKNVAEAMERIRIEEIIKALKYDSQVQIAIPQGAIVFQGTGSNAGGPVTVTGVNIAPVTGTGIIG